jgi:hypothetical protein
MPQKSSSPLFTLVVAASALTVFCLLLCIHEASADTIPSRFFGMHSMAAFPLKPYGLFRTWDHYGTGDHNWRDLEKSKGVFTWKPIDDLVDALKGKNVDILYCFGKTPSWAAASPTSPPVNIQDWDDFVTAFVNRYHASIKYLEVWNEAMAGEGFYTGTIPQLVNLARHLDSIANTIDPTITILTPDATGGSYNMTKFYGDYFAAGGGAYADVIAFHGYCSMAGANQITPAEEIINIVTALKGAMNSYGQGSKPIFCTEGDWGTEGSNSNNHTTDECVAFLARHYLLQWSLGVSVYAWYSWDNNNGSWQWGQLWTPAGGLNAAGIAYGELYKWMVGATMSQPYTAKGSVGTCGFTRPGGYQALAVWDTNTASPSTFTVPSGYIQYRDLAGGLHSISGTTVTIGIKPILLENSTATSISRGGLHAAVAAPAAGRQLVVLYNMRGQVLMQRNSTESVMRDMHGLTPGIYLMRVQMAGRAASNLIVCEPR